MKRTLLPIAAAVLFLATLALAVEAQSPLQIYPDQSIGTLSETPIDGNRWSETVFPFGNYSGTLSSEPVFCRTYLHFDLAGVPADATIDSATLHVYVDDFWPGPGSAPMVVYPVTAGWPTGDAWNDMANWPALGGGGATTAVSSPAGWFTWDVTALAQGWQAGGTNYGLALAATDPYTITDYWAAARRLTAADPNTRPYLTVSYTEPQPEPTATPEPPPPPPPPPPDPTAEPQPTPTPQPALLPTTGANQVMAWPWLVLAGGLMVAAALIFRRR